MQQSWVHNTRRHLVCIDSYTDGVPRGRVYGPLEQTLSFSSLSQFLVRMEELLEERQEPQAYTVLRRFSEFLEPNPLAHSGPCQRKGQLATFELDILFRQNTSWQGLLQWRETGREQSFRSVLELVILMDSALKTL